MSTAADRHLPDRIPTILTDKKTPKRGLPTKNRRHKHKLTSLTNQKITTTTYSSTRCGTGCPPRLTWNCKMQDGLRYKRVPGKLPLSHLHVLPTHPKHRERPVLLDGVPGVSTGCACVCVRWMRRIPRETRVCACVGANWRPIAPPPSPQCYRRVSAAEEYFSGNFESSRVFVPAARLPFQQNPTLVTCETRERC